MVENIILCIDELNTYSKWKAFHWRHHRSRAAKFAVDLQGRVSRKDYKGCQMKIRQEVDSVRSKASLGGINLDGGYFKILYRAHQALEHQVQDQAAMVITHAFREAIAGRGYLRMSEGTLHNELKKKAGRPIDLFREVSHTNLARLRSLVMAHGGGLDSAEKGIIDRLTTQPIFVVHYSNRDDLIKKNAKGEDIFALYSREKLIEKKIIFPKKNTTETDIVALKDDDFAFFSVVTLPDAKKQSRFGREAYVLEVDDAYFRNHMVFMTAGDYAAEQQKIKMKGTSAQLITAYTSDENLPGLSSREMYKLKRAYGDCLSQCFVNYEIPLTDAMQYHCLMEGDILPGLAFMVILFRRLIRDTLSSASVGDPAAQQTLKNIGAKLAAPQLSPLMLNGLINSVVNPLIKVPRFVISGGARKVQI